MSAPADDPALGSPKGVLALAASAFGVLAAGPLYVLVDTAVVGHLGAVHLAGLAVGGVVLAQVALRPLLQHLLPLFLPPVVVESEAPLHLQGRQSFSAAMARSSPPTVQPTYARALSTRSLPKGRPCPSA